MNEEYAERERQRVRERPRARERERERERKGIPPSSFDLIVKTPTL